MVWGFQTLPKSWPSMWTFWANHYLEISNHVSKMFRGEPPPYFFLYRTNSPLELFWQWAWLRDTIISPFIKMPLVMPSLHPINFFFYCDNAPMKLTLLSPIPIRYNILWGWTTPWFFVSVNHALVFCECEPRPGFLTPKYLFKRCILFLLLA